MPAMETDQDAGSEHEDSDEEDNESVDEDEEQELAQGEVSSGRLVLLTPRDWQSCVSELCVKLQIDGGMRTLRRGCYDARFSSVSHGLSSTVVQL